LKAASFEAVGILLPLVKMQASNIVRFNRHYIGLR
jgi:hypothetical protein